MCYNIDQYTAKDNVLPKDQCIAADTDANPITARQWLQWTIQKMDKIVNPVQSQMAGIPDEKYYENRENSLQTKSMRRFIRL